MQQGAIDTKVQWIRMRWSR